MNTIERLELEIQEVFSTTEHGGIATADLNINKTGNKRPLSTLGTDSTKLGKLNDTGFKILDPKQTKTFIRSSKKLVEQVTIIIIISNCCDF